MILYTKDFVFGICLGLCLIFMVGTIINQQIYISRLGVVEKRLDVVDKRLYVVDKKQEVVGKKQKGFDKKLEGVGKRHVNVNKSLEDFDQRLESIDKNVQFLLESTDNIHHARLCIETGIILVLK